MLHMQFRCFRSVVRHMVQMSLGGVSVVCGSFVVPCFVVPRGFTMMPGRVFVVLGCVPMVFRCLFGHFPSLS